jgi:hypothetical protein
LARANEGWKSRCAAPMARGRNHPHALTARAAQDVSRSAAIDHELSHDVRCASGGRRARQFARLIRSQECLHPRHPRSNPVLHLTRNQARKREIERMGEGLRLIQSLLLGISLASRHLSVRRASVDRRIGVSQMPIPKTERVCCPIWASPILPWYVAAITPVVVGRVWASSNTALGPSKSRCPDPSTNGWISRMSRRRATGEERSSCRRPDRRYVIGRSSTTAVADVIAAIPERTTVANQSRYCGRSTTGAMVTAIGSRQEASVSATIGDHE